MWPESPQQVAVPQSHQSPCHMHDCGEMVSYMRVGVSPNHVGFFCAVDHYQGGWTPHDAFRPGGKYEGLLPAKWFESPRKKREKALTIRDGIRYETLVAANDTCCVCHRRRPAQPGRQSYVLAWTQQYHAGIYRQIQAEFEGRTAVGVPPTATDWMRFMPEDLQISIKHAIERAELDADHVIPVWLLKEIRPTIESRMGKGAFSFLANDCCVPSCRSCNAGRPHRALEPIDTLKGRYIRAKFGGNSKVAEQSQEFKVLSRALAYAKAHLAEHSVGGA